jgi:CrcB protein
MLAAVASVLSRSGRGQAGTGRYGRAVVDPAAARLPSPASPRRVLGAIAAGGVVGALSRYQIGRWWPTPVDGFPAATLLINLVGCLLIGAVLVLITERLTPHPLVRPFVVTGVLGGFTTFSTYALDIQVLLSHGRVDTALAYLVLTAAGSVGAAALGMTSARRLLIPRSR